MIRMAIGIFILFGAVGYEDMMIEMNQHTPLLPFLIKATIGIALVGWGVHDLKEKGAFDDNY
ncbi:MAG: hypothetical protein CMA07_06785 [Euryarchaeota archaeon]|nr:hypothetical protein [Euryarchaeota archaeon]